MEKFTNEYKIRQNECNENLEIRIGALWDIMQDAADLHAIKLGFSQKAMFANNNFFLLARMDLKINRLPKVREKIKVTTYPAGVSKLFCVRKYDIYDKNNVLLAKSTCLWIIASLDTMRPLRPHKEYPEIELFNKTYDESIPEKISTPENLEKIYEIKAEYDDIDVNGHVNNSRYINWIENSLRKGFSEIEVNYLKETKLGETLEVFKSDNIIKIGDKFIAKVK